MVATWNLESVLIDNSLSKHVLGCASENLELSGRSLMEM
jgi:hypothetical protein